MKRSMVSAAKILIATSDTTVARELHARIKGLGYDVIGVAASRDEALTKIGESKPDLIMTDIGLNGLRAGINTGPLLQASSGIPVIYITGSIGQTTIRRAKSTGPFGYVFRPYDEQQLLVTIETALVRHQLESRLSESRQWLDTTLSSIGDGVIATDEKGLVRFMNPVATGLTGYPYTDATGMPLPEVFALTDELSHKRLELAPFQDQNGRKKITEVEAMLSSRNGMLIPVQANATSMHGENGEVLGMVVVFRDTTKQRQASSEIQLQASRAEALVRMASRLNGQLQLMTVLDTVCLVTNQSIKAAGTAVFLQDSRKAVFREMAAHTTDPALRASRGMHFEIPEDLIRSSLSRENPVLVIADVKDQAGWRGLEWAQKHNIKTLVVAALFRRDQLIGALLSAFEDRQPNTLVGDTSLLRGLADQASSAIENAQLFEQVRRGRERQRRLSKSLVDIQEDERRHIARELHDHLGQALTGLLIMLESAIAQLDGRPKAELEEIHTCVRESIEQVREMSLNLRPSMLDDMGLLSTLRWHFSRYTSQTGIQVSLQCDEEYERFPVDIETAAYRIVQEALTNVARYAQVKTVRVGLAVHDQALWIEVLDQGKGFDAAVDPERPSSGLGGMSERASMVGGYLRVISSPNQGTQIVAALPLTKRPLERRQNDRDGPFG